MRVPHPIPYQGSKRQLAPVILQYLPQHTTRLIEPFAGSAAVSIYAAACRKMNQFVLNDINAPLMSLWEAIIKNPEKLAERYDLLWQMQQGRERQFYDLVRTRFNQSHRPYYLLYLLARCVKAAVRYNTLGEFNQSPDNRRKGRQPQTMRQHILDTSKLLQNVYVMAEDYRASLQLADQTDVVYLDPPYQGVCAGGDPRYLRGIHHEEFVYSLSDLNQRSIAYIVSYDGKTGSKSFGQILPKHLQLKRIELNAGRSSQSTLLGRKDTTYESLYLSPALIARLENHTLVRHQLPLFTEFA